ncbi:UNVERIFIED_CONTAM: hypothetical protein Cloal_4278 [Acetivibrio alkalicellulosi]
MKRAGLTLIFLLFSLGLSSCVNSVEISSEEGVNSVKMSSKEGVNSVEMSYEEVGMVKILSNVDNEYKRLKDINAKSVNEILLNFDINTYGVVVKEALDGYIAASMTNSTSEDQMLTPIIQKLNEDGKIIWEREYNYPVTNGQVTSMCNFTDGSFIFLVKINSYFSDYHENSFIIKCDKDGKEIWKKELSDFTEDMLKYMFVNSEGDIFLVGETFNNIGISDIVISKLNAHGDFIKKSSFGGSDFETIYTASYNNELGIIISGISQSSDFEDIKRHHFWFVGCIDEELNLKWIFPAEEKEIFLSEQLLVDKENIYVQGYFLAEKDKSNVGFLLKLDKNGERVWSENIFTEMFSFGRAMEVLENGNIIISAGIKNKGSLVILNDSGKEIKRLDNLDYVANKIVSTFDGGFIVTAERNIKSVEQPVFISSIWYDTECVAIKYKSDYHIEWRKTYDKYKNEKGLDFVLPLRNGKIVLEK